MKKLLSLLLCAVLIASVLPGLPAMAFDINAEQSNGQTPIEEYISDHPIRVKKAYTSGQWEVPVVNGSASGTMPDGTRVSATGAPAGAVKLVVHKIVPNEAGKNPGQENSPYYWFQNLLKSHGDVIQPYWIYYIDINGVTIPANGARITIDALVNVLDVQVFSAPTPAESAGMLTSNLSGGRIRFLTNGHPFYILVGKSFEMYRDEILDKIDDKHEKDEDDVRKDRIDEAYKDAEDYKYDPDKSFDENMEALDKILEELEKDLEDLKKFEDYREEILDKTDGLHKPGESPSRKEEIDKVYQQIKDYEYDFDKTLQENKDALYKLMDSLCKDLGVSTPKTSDQFRMELWLTLAGVSLLLLLVLLLLLRKRRKKNSDT